MNESSFTIIDWYTRFVKRSITVGSTTYQVLDNHSYMDMGCVDVVWGASPYDLSERIALDAVASLARRVGASAVLASTQLGSDGLRLCLRAVGTSVIMVEFLIVTKQEFSMFTTEQRDQVRLRVMELARSDHRVTGGAFTGSMAFEGGDRWSDIDVAFGITNGISLETVLQDWTQVLDREFSVIDHFDLRSDSSIYRVFLLQTGLEADVAVTPGEDFGARGPQFRVLFGSVKKLQETLQPSASSFIGPGWHHILHARSSIERNKPWQAEYWISGIRDHTLSLACLRFGENPYYGRGVDNLPAVVTGPLLDALVRSLDEPELRRALAVATRCFVSELEECDPGLCSRLSPLLQEFGVT